MKFISRVQQVLVEGATQVAIAVEQATQTVSTELQNGLAEGRTTIADAGGKLAAIPPRLSEAACLLDPHPMVSDLTALLETLQEDVRQLMQSAGRAGTGLRAPLQDLTAMQAEVTRVLDRIQALPAQVSQAATTDLTDLQELARQTLVRAQTVGMRVQGLPARIQAFAAELPDLLNAGDAHAVTAAAADQVHAEVETLRQELLSERDKLGTELGLVGTRFSERCTLAIATVQDITAGLQQALQQLIQKIEVMAQALRQALEDLRAVMESGHDRLDELAAALSTPMEKAHAAIEAVAAEVDAVGTIVDQVIAGIDAQLDRLQRIVDAVKTAVNDAATAVDTTLVGLRELLTDMGAEIDGLIPRLRALPDELHPVYEQIGVAHGVIDDIQIRIPPFIDQADTTLLQASVELDQAEALCDDAIATCTLYQMRAPALIAARLLFVGVKSSLPSIRSTITAARGSLRTAGKTATSLLDEAHQAVVAVQGVLDQAVQQLRGVIEQLVGLLVQLQQSLADAGNKLIEIGEMLGGKVAALNEQVDAVVTEVRTKVTTAVESMEARPTVDYIATQVRELHTALIAPLRAELDGAIGQAHDALNTLIDQLDRPTQALDANLNELLQQVPSLQATLDVPLQRLQDMQARAQATLDELLQQACGCVDQATDQGLSALAMADNAIDILRDYANTRIDELSSRMGATAASIGINLARVPDPATLLRTFEDDCLAMADSATKALLTDMDAVRAANDRAGRAMADTVTAEAALRDEAIRNTPELPQPNAIEEQAAASLSPAREKAERHAERAETEVRAQQEALRTVDATWVDLPDDLRAALNQAGEEAKSTCDLLQSEVARLVAASDAVATASNAAEEQVGEAAQRSHKEVSHLRDQAQSQLDAVSAEIVAVQACTNVARVDLQRAEAIVDAEVEKYGGAPRSTNAEAAAETAEEAAAAAGDASESARAGITVPGANVEPNMDRSGSTDGTADSSDASTDTWANTGEEDTDERPEKADTESLQVRPAEANGSAAMTHETIHSPEVAAPKDARFSAATQSPPTDDALEHTNTEAVRQAPIEGPAATQTQPNSPQLEAKADTAPQRREDSDIKPRGSKPAPPSQRPDAAGKSPHATTEPTEVADGFAPPASQDDNKLDAATDRLAEGAADTLSEVNLTSTKEVGAGTGTDMNAFSLRTAAPEPAVPILEQLSTDSQEQAEILPIQRGHTADDPQRLNAWRATVDGDRRSSPQTSTGEEKPVPATENTPPTDRSPDKPTLAPPLSTSNSDTQRVPEASVIAAGDNLDVLDVASYTERVADDANTSSAAQTMAAEPASNSAARDRDPGKASASYIPEPFESPPTP